MRHGRTVTKVEVTGKKTLPSSKRCNGRDSKVVSDAVRDYERTNKETNEHITGKEGDFSPVKLLSLEIE